MDGVAEEIKLAVIAEVRTLLWSKPYKNKRDGLMDAGMHCRFSCLLFSALGHFLGNGYSIFGGKQFITLATEERAYGWGQDTNHKAGHNWLKNLDDKICDFSIKLPRKKQDPDRVWQEYDHPIIENDIC